MGNFWATVGQQRVKIGQQTWNCCALKGNYWEAVGHWKAILDYLGTIGQILSTKGPISGQLLGHYCGSGTNRQVIFKIWAMLVFFNDCFRKVTIIITIIYHWWSEWWLWCQDAPYVTKRPTSYLEPASHPQTDTRYKLYSASACIA